MPTAHVKKGDEVVVIAGSEKGGRGKILQVKTKNHRVVIEGLKMMKRHTRKNARQQQGGIIEREGSIHISNVRLAGATEEGAVAIAPAQPAEAPKA